MAPAFASPVVHLQLQTPNLPRACAFYTRLLGWRAERVEAGGGCYLALDLGEAIDGGVVERDGGPALWLPYVEVDDVAETARRARLLGGSVTLEPRDGPAGWRSVIAAPAGAEIGLWQPKG